MTTDTLLHTHDDQSRAQAIPVSTRIRHAWRRLAAWANYCADQYAAAAMYQNLSALSDADLHRQGLSRSNLARDVSATCGHQAGPGHR